MEKELTPQQIAAIRAAKELGDLLSQEHPEIADEYRGGLNQTQLAERYGLDELTQSRRIARQAVLIALKNLLPEEERAELKTKKLTENGKRCFLENKGVHGLIAEVRKQFGQKAARVLAERGIGIYALTPEQRTAHGKKLHKDKIGIHGYTHEERVEIGKKTHTDGKGVHALTNEQHSANGTKAKNMGVGIHALTHEQRAETARKTIADGKGFGAMSKEQREAIGRKTHADKKGVHGLTSAQHSANGKKAKEMGVGLHALTTEERKAAARLALEARGQTPWSEEEASYCAKLIKSPDYRHMHGPVLYIQNQRIADELNEQFHEGKKVRTKKGVVSFRFNAGTRKYLE